MITQKIKLKQNALNNWLSLNAYLSRTKPVDADDVRELYDLESRTKKRSTFLRRLLDRAHKLELRNKQAELNK